MITIDDIQLSPSYRLSDLTKSDSFPNIDNTPYDPTHLDNLRTLANFLETLKMQHGDFIVTSAYRSPALNAALASVGYVPSTKSQHLTGQAADIVPYASDGSVGSQLDILTYFAKILSSGMSFGQVILEKPSKVKNIHISFPSAVVTGAVAYLGDDGHYHSYEQPEIDQLVQSYASGTIQDATADAFISPNDPISSSDDSEAAYEPIDAAPSVSNSPIFIASALILVFLGLIALKKSGVKIL